LLDENLTERYGAMQKQYEQHNRVDYINDVVVLMKDTIPVACGALKECDETSVELKRIFVRTDQRRQGLAKLIVQELEKIAREKGVKYALLETGIKQIEAINLYKNNGFVTIENYGPYIGNVNSVCMRKVL
jgi:GNAT superfamily N-acetyltransferase